MKRLYALLLHLFPRAYWRDYGDELQAVFGLSLDEAQKRSKLAVVVASLRELIGLPGAILSEHLRQRRSAHKNKKFSAYLNFTYGSRREFISSLYPFLLFGFISPVIDLLTQSGLLVPRSALVNGIGVVLVTLTGILIFVGLVTGCPRWSLPYAGFLFSLLSAYGSGLWLDRGHFIPYMALYDRSWLLGQIAYQGSLWVGLTVISLSLVMLVLFIPRFRRFKNDWTLLVFLLYGATPFALAISFDDYIHEEPYELVAFLILVSGVWFYLHTNDPHRRFWSLFGGMTVTLFFAAVGKAMIGLSQPWFRGDQIDWWGHEMMSTVTIWMWIALSMIVPLALSLLSQNNNQVLTPSEI
jgi:hypothetical protein